MDVPPEQFAQLYQDNAPALLAYFRAQPALAGNAEDLLHDTFVRAIRRPEKMREAITPRAYLFGIARHVGLDTLRTRRPLEALSEEPVARVPVEDARIEPMRAAIAALPDLQREALSLKLQHDLSYTEIAQVLDVPVGTVRSRLHHAVAALRDTLNPNSRP